MNRSLAFIFVVALTLFGASCTPTSAPLIPIPAQEQVSVGGSWHDIGDGISRLRYSFAPDHDSYLILYRIPASGFTWRFADDPVGHTVSTWRAMTGALIAVNGTYFDEALSPAGLFITASKRVGKGSFDADKSGVIELAPTFALIDTPEERFDRAHAAEAAQSYPFLVLGGKPAVGSESGKSARRTFIGTDTDGNRYVGIVPDAPLTLYRLARVLTKTGVTWDRVLNLDGGPSSGLAAKTERSDETADSLVPVPDVIVIERR